MHDGFDAAAGLVEPLGGIRPNSACAANPDHNRRALAVNPDMVSAVPEWANHTLAGRTSRRPNPKTGQQKRRRNRLLLHPVPPRQLRAGRSQVGWVASYSEEARL